MNFSFTPEQVAWRKEVQQFLKKNPKENFEMQGMDEGWGYGSWSNEFSRLLGSKGWISLIWPKPYGMGRPIMDLLILFEELAYSEAPWFATAMSFSEGESIIAIGSDELKKELLPGIASGEELFWLGMSEPEAGSDLLGLQTRAMEKDDHYVITGQKVWTGNADRGRYGLLFAKTEFDPNVPKTKTISMFLIDKNLPGITVRPLLNLAGEITHNEVFFDDVKVPKKYLLGGKNLALPHMFKTLDYDRFWARFIKPPFCKIIIEQLVQYARETRRDGVLLSKDPIVRHKLAESAVETEACRVMFWEAGWKLQNKKPATLEIAVAKLLADEMGQRLFRTGVDIMGPYALLGKDNKWSPLESKIQRLNLLAYGHTIAGGTSEIIRNTIATVGLGLAKG